jgi:hypothetical protein
MLQMSFKILRPNHMLANISAMENRVNKVNDPRPFKKNKFKKKSSEINKTDDHQNGTPLYM